MVCYRPQPTVLLSATNRLKFFRDEDIAKECEAQRYGKFYRIPCCNCIGCSATYSRAWAIRASHEAYFYDQYPEQNLFITLTYSPKHLPPLGHLNRAVIPSFMRRLREYFFGRAARLEQIRYLSCGEYGEKYGRPHYHLCLFNSPFDDLSLQGRRDGVDVFTSADLEYLWPYGMSEIGVFSHDCANYTAGYVAKKLLRERKLEEEFDIFAPPPPNLPKEFVQRSTHPGLGKRFFDEFYKSIYAKDCIVLNGTKMGVPPRYYDRQLEKVNPLWFKTIKNQRLLSMETKFETLEELSRQEKVKMLEFRKHRERFSRVA